MKLIKNVYDSSGSEVIKMYNSSQEVVWRKDYAVRDRSYYLDKYFTVTAITSGSVKGTDTDFEYRINGNSEWSVWYSKIGNSANSNGVRLSPGDEIEIRCISERLKSIRLIFENDYDSTFLFNVSGNIASLITGENFDKFPDEWDNTRDDALFTLFFEGTGVVDASNLILPETFVTSFYRMMFRNCRELVNGPELYWVGTIRDACCWQMFYNCTKLKSLTCFATGVEGWGTRDWLKNAGPGEITINYHNYDRVNNNFLNIPEGWDIVNLDDYIS